MSVNQASRSYSILATTLRRYVEKNPDQYLVHGGRFRKALSDTLEAQLSAYLQEMGSRGFGLTPTQVCKFAFEIADRNHLQNTFNPTARQPGLDWFKAFLLRNPEVSVRAPEATSIGRLAGFNQPQVDRFFELLTDVMTQYKFSASRIFNCDESGIPTVPTKLPKVVTSKGARRVPITQLTDSTSAIPVDNAPIAHGSSPAIAAVIANCVSPQEIRPYPVSERSSSTHRSKRFAMTARIVTSSPFKNKLLAKQINKVPKPIENGKTSVAATRNRLSRSLHCRQRKRMLKDVVGLQITAKRRLRKRSHCLRMRRWFLVEVVMKWEEWKTG
jgi:hypothetical protein